MLEVKAGTIQLRQQDSKKAQLWLLCPKFSNQRKRSRIFIAMLEKYPICMRSHYYTCQAGQQQLMQKEEGSLNSVEAEGILNKHRIWRHLDDAPMQNWLLIAVFVFDRLIVVAKKNTCTIFPVQISLSRKACISCSSLELSLKLYHTGADLAWLHVNLFQNHLFLHQLTHNMTKDCSLNYQFSTWKLQAQNIRRTYCVHKLVFVLTFRTIYVHKMFWAFYVLNW